MILSIIDKALCAWRFSSGVTSLERATAKLRLAQRRIFSGSVIPAQLRKSDMLVRLVIFILSADSSSSSSKIFSAKALLSKRRSIINCKKPSEEDNLSLLLCTISHILYTAYPSGVLSPVSLTLIRLSPSHFIRLVKRASIFKILPNT